MTEAAKNNLVPPQDKRDIEKEVSFIEMCCRLEGEHLQSTQFSERDAVGWFPDVGEVVISEKIAEWRSCFERLTLSLEAELSEKPKLVSVEQWPIKKIFIEWKYEDEFQKIYKQLRRLAVLMDSFTCRAPPDSSDWNARIEKAKKVPIETVLDIKLRPSGNKLFGHCPLHTDKSPSFYIYRETNTFYCFGCGEGGDIIKLIISLHSYSFKEALKHIEHYG